MPGADESEGLPPDAVPDRLVPGDDALGEGLGGAGGDLVPGNGDGPVEEVGRTLDEVAPPPSSCISVNPAKVNFGGTLLGMKAVMPVEVSCCGEEPLLLYGTAMAEGSSLDFVGRVHHRMAGGKGAIAHEGGRPV